MAVKRFRLYYFDPVSLTGHPATMRENTQGDYVLYADYEALEKEASRLREFEWMYKDLCK